MVSDVLGHDLCWYILDWRIVWVDGLSETVSEFCQEPQPFSITLSRLVEDAWDGLSRQQVQNYEFTRGTPSAYGDRLSWTWSDLGDGCLFRCGRIEHGYPSTAHSVVLGSLRGRRTQFLGCIELSRPVVGASSKQWDIEVWYYHSPPNSDNGPTYFVGYLGWI